MLAVEMEAAALYAFAAAARRSVVCFAHVTNSMAQTEGDFEKGEADGPGNACRHRRRRGRVVVRHGRRGTLSSRECLIETEGRSALLVRAEDRARRGRRGLVARQSDKFGTVEHDFGGVLELKRNLFQLLGAFREAGLIVHIFELMNASKFYRPRFCPTAYRLQRRPADAGSEAGNPMRTTHTPRRLAWKTRWRCQGCLDAAAGSAML